MGQVFTHQERIRFLRAIIERMKNILKISGDAEKLRRHLFLDPSETHPEVHSTVQSYLDVASTELAAVTTLLTSFNGGTDKGFALGKEWRAGQERISHFNISPSTIQAVKETLGQELGVYCFEELTAGSQTLELTNAALTSNIGVVTVSSVINSVTLVVNETLVDDDDDSTLIIRLVDQP